MHDCARIPPVFCTLALQVLPDLFVVCLKNAIFSATHELGPCDPQCMQTKMEIWHAKRNFKFSHAESQPKNFSIHTYNYGCA